MSVLVDTSVWIRFLVNRSPYAAELDGLLSRDEVSGHDFIHSELLIGDKGARRQLLADYDHMYQAPVVPHREVVAFVRDRKNREQASLRCSVFLGRKLGSVPPAPGLLPRAAGEA